MEKRYGICPWRNLDHLKDNYSRVLSIEVIDKIIEDINKSGRFKKRINTSEEEDNDQFLNLVDSVIINYLGGNMPADSIGQQVRIGSKIKFRGHEYTIKNFLQGKGQNGCCAYEFNEPLDTTEIADEINIDLIEY